MITPIMYLLSVRTSDDRNEQNVAEAAPASGCRTKFSEEIHYDQVSTCHRRRLQDFLSRSRPEECPNHSLLARLSNVVAHVPQPHSSARRPLPSDRSRFARIRLLGRARPRAV